MTRIKSNIFFSSDLHFHHNKCFNLRKEQFNLSSMEDMNALIMENWNSVVGENDIVYLLGDITMARKPIGHLNGKIILIRGNHDHSDCINELFKNNIVYALVDSATVVLRKQKFHLSHHPTRRHVDETDTCYVHGHLHGNDHHDDEYAWTKQDPYQVDVGIDCHWTGFKPVSFTQLMQKYNTQLKGE